MNTKTTVVVYGLTFLLVGAGVYWFFKSGTASKVVAADWWKNSFGLLKPGTQIPDYTGDLGQAISDKAEREAQGADLTPYAKERLADPNFTPGVPGTPSRNIIDGTNTGVGDENGGI